MRSLRTTLIISTLSIIVAFALLSTILLQVQTTKMEQSQEVIQQNSPALETLEHLVETIHQDNVIVQQYLSATDPDTLEILESQLQVLMATCEELISRSHEEIELLPEMQSSNSIKLGTLVYGSVERTRKALLRTHREVLNGTASSSKSNEIEQKYTALLLESTKQLNQAIHDYEKKTKKRMQPNHIY